MEKFYCEKINYYKLLFTAAITAFYGCCGWFYINRFSLSSLDLVIIIIILLILLPMSIIAVICKMRYYIEKLKIKD